METQLKLIKLNNSNETCIDCNKIATILVDSPEYGQMYMCPKCIKSIYGVKNIAELITI